MRRTLLVIAVTAACCAFAAPPSHTDETRAELRKLLEGGNPQTALSRFHYLGAEHAASAALLRAWDDVSNEATQRNVAFVLAALGDPASEGLLVQLTDSRDAVLRMSAAQGLGKLKTKHTDALIPLLADDTLGVRREAAKAAGQTRQKKLAKILLKAAHGEGEPEVRAAMLIAAGQCGDPKTANDLASFLTASSESTRQAAAQALCLLGDARGFDFAKKQLSSDDKFVRRQGVALFEGMPAKKAAPYLEPLLRDPDKHVSAASARILYQGGDASKLDWLVLASHLSKPDDRLIIESELETLMLTDEQRKAILKSAGIE